LHAAIAADRRNPARLLPVFKDKIDAEGKREGSVRFQTRQLLRVLAWGTFAPRAGNMASHGGIIAPTTSFVPAFASGRGKPSGVHFLTFLFNGLLRETARSEARIFTPP
jgi:hypothetical protein